MHSRQEASSPSCESVSRADSWPSSFPTSAPGPLMDRPVGECWIKMMTAGTTLQGLRPTGASVRAR
eukprot:7202689-Alexandrium_andersonii.AAC.1